MRMEKAALPMPAPKPKPAPKPNKPEEEPTDEGSSSTNPDKGDMDFMKNVRQNTRYYNHVLRKGYDKFNRVDFTKTLAFKSAQELRVNKKSGSLEANASFNLNDQVSSF